MTYPIKLIILDRDGVINQDSDHYIKSVDEFLLLPNTVEAITRLKNTGWTVAIATNQSGLARQFYTCQTLHLMHEKLQVEVVNVLWIFWIFPTEVKDIFWRNTRTLALRVFLDLIRLSLILISHCSD